MSTSMYNQLAVLEFNELVEILKKMPIPDLKKNLNNQSNIRWLQRNISPQWENADQALKILAKCDETNSKSSGVANPVYQEILRQSYANANAMQEKYFKEKGLEVVASGWPGEEVKITQVKLNFTAEQWVDLMNAEGEFLPACCATISSVRDVLIDTLREGQFIKSTDLFKIVSWIKEHGDCDEITDDPLDLIIKTWEAIKNDANLTITAPLVDPNNLEDAFGILYQSSAILSWNFLTHRGEEKTKHEAIRLREFSKILPAINTIYQNLKENKFQPVEGYGIISNEKIVELTNGLAIFQDKNNAEELTENLNKSENNRKKQNLKSRIDDLRMKRESKTEKMSMRNYEVKRVRISVENSIEILEAN